MPLPVDSLWWREVFNSGHTILFAVLSFVIYRQVEDALHSSKAFMAYLVTFLLGMLFGAVVELLQGFVQREASLNDFYRDALGMAAGLCLVAAYNLKAVRIRRPVFVFLMMMSAGFVMLGMSSLAQLSWDYLEKGKAFPVIVDFDSGWSASFVRLNRGEYSGIKVIELAPDWTGYHILRMDVFSEGEATISLTLRVHDDKHNQDYADRFNVKLSIRPGINQIKVPLINVERGPVSRKLDMENIAGIGLFTIKPDDFDRLHLGRMFLE